MKTRLTVALKGQPSITWEGPWYLSMARLEIAFTFPDYNGFTLVRLPK